jgi:hypothetical protein
MSSLSVVFVFERALKKDVFVVTTLFAGLALVGVTSWLRIVFPAVGLAAAGKVLPATFDIPFGVPLEVVTGRLLPAPFNVPFDIPFEVLAGKVLPPPFAVGVAEVGILVDGVGMLVDGDATTFDRIDKLAEE